MDEEKRFKHKLNMLEPGSRMLKWIGILIVIGLLLYFFRFRMAARDISIVRIHSLGAIKATVKKEVKIAEFKISH